MISAGTVAKVRPAMKSDAMLVHGYVLASKFRALTAVQKSDARSMRYCSVLVGGGVSAGGELLLLV